MFVLWFNYIISLLIRVFRAFDKVVAASSQNSINVFDLRHNSEFFTLHHVDIKDPQIESVCGVKFANTDPNLLFISTASGKIYQQDLRVSAKKVEVFTLDGG